MTEMTPAPLVRTSLESGVLTLTLGAMPAHPLSLAMIEALQAELERIANDTAVQVVVLHGPGHIFCAGHDLKEIARHRRDADDGLAYLQELFGRCAQMMQAIVTLPQPVIAMVEGIATAGGLQLLASCDLAFAAPEATFALPGIANGGFCTTPSVAVGRTIARKKAMELGLAGTPFDAGWALDAGLINRIFPAQDLARETYAFAQSLTAAIPSALAAGKRMFYHQLELPLAQAYAEATEVMIGHFMNPDRIAKDQKNWGGR